jgi:chorismate dehydratase
MMLLVNTYPVIFFIFMRISAVSYLNTKPFIYGIYRSALGDHLEISLDIPSVCASKLLSGEADIALAPVAVIPDLPQAWLVSDYCIGATGPVNTVCLFSERPLGEIERIYLDFHSRTSVALVRVLCAKYWHIEPEFVPAGPGFEQKIGGSTAAVIIGDRAFQYLNRFPVVIDLAEQWVKWTHMPFVFAAWMSVKPLQPEFIQQLNHAFRTGIEHIPELMKILPSLPGINLEHYFRHNISYELDDAKWRGLNHFLSHLAQENGYQLRR